MATAAILGVPLHGEFSSADASALDEANSRFTLYGASSVTAVTLDADDVVAVTGLVISVGATALTVEVYDGADNVVDAGEQIVEVNLPVNGSIAISFPVPHYCQKGTFPKVNTSVAGAVDCTLNGVVRRKGA